MQVAKQDGCTLMHTTQEGPKSERLCKNIIPLRQRMTWLGREEADTQTDRKMDECTRNQNKKIKKNWEKSEVYIDK
ncbi:hypothetical protein E2C01_095138 [Portunus trituberculatus]|uniref:Uncharacterized protein n=1 Tax=Portunus trituberculatus TaxID=210409 RepID=A0A5B7K3G1_PORTR|nr:hypothetical protein [Portunus trituberculatus]